MLERFILTDKSWPFSIFLVIETTMSPAFCTSVISSPFRVTVHYKNKSSRKQCYLRALERYRVLHETFLFLNNQLKLSNGDADHELPELLHHCSVLQKIKP